LIIPRRIISGVRLLDIFQQKHGHVRQHDNFPVNGNGEFQPWLTYPIIEFLKSFSFSGMKIFEYGAGSSTLYWAAQAQHVFSVEHHGAWYQSLLSKIPNNVTLVHESDLGKYAGTINQFPEQFDIIVIDGAERHQCAKAATQMLAPGGMIILDNAEWYPKTAEYLASTGLIEIPFSGFSPNNAFCSTSTAFLSRSFSFPLKADSRQPPVGGKALTSPAYDDEPPQN
jgi:hypothetical protein